MKLPFYIARRYLFSKKSQNVINIISGISVLGVMISTMALVVVLSGFNGIEAIVEKLYTAFDSDIRITALKGKSFDENTFSRSEIEALPSIKGYSNVIEETTILQHKVNDYSENSETKWIIAKMKGVEPQFLEMNNIDSLIYEGEMKLGNNQFSYGVFGIGVLARLEGYIHTEGVDVTPYEIIQVRALLGGKKLSKQREEAIRDTTIMVSSVFKINPQLHNNYYVVPINYAKALLKYDNQINAVEIAVKEGYKNEDIKTKIEEIVGSDFEVKTKYEQNELVFKTNKAEKLAVFFILCLIFVLATFNIIGSLTMLVLDKKKDIETFRSMGATNKMMKQVFFYEGLLINFIGGVTGITLGLIVCWLQQKFSLVTMDMGDKIEAFPVEVEWTDLLSILGAVVVIGLVSSYFPVKYLIQKHYSKG